MLLAPTLGLDEDKRQALLEAVLACDRAMPLRPTT
jgi:hypothetical protein